MSACVPEIDDMKEKYLHNKPFLQMGNNHSEQDPA